MNRFQLSGDNAAHHRQFILSNFANFFRPVFGLLIVRSIIGPNGESTVDWIDSSVVHCSRRLLGRLLGRLLDRRFDRLISRLISRLIDRSRVE